MTNEVEYRLEDGIAYIELNRPEKRNALADSTVLAIKEALDQLNADEAAYVGIISGRGKVFSSGADVKQRQLRPREELLRYGGAEAPGTSVGEVLSRQTNSKPLIAAVHGYAMGAGMYLALQTEIIVASEETKFQVTEIPRGLDAAMFLELFDKRGAGNLGTEITITGRFLPAREAYDHGIITRVVPEGQHVKEAEVLARQIMENPPLAVRAMVRYRRGGLERAMLEAKIAGPRDLHLTADFRESASSFIEKRRPNFVGR